MDPFARAKRQAPEKKTLFLGHNDNIVAGVC